MNSFILSNNEQSQEIVIQSVKEILQANNGYEPDAIINILNVFKTNNNFNEIINLVGKKTSKKIIENLLENENNVIKNPKSFFDNE